MKTSLTASELCQKLDQQLETKVDYLVSTKNLYFMNDADHMWRADGEPIENSFSLAFETEDDRKVFGINEIAHGQISARLQIPKKYYDRMREDSPNLLRENVRHWFENESERRMIRTLGGDTARAFLSEKYRPLDNWDLAQAVIPQLIEHKAEIVSCDITESKMYIKAINYRSQGEVEVGQPVASGVIVSNSEVGQGALFVAPYFERLICKNGMIANDWAKRKYHVGAKNSDGLSFDKAYELFTDKTKELTDQAFWHQVKDLVGAALDPNQLDEMLEPMRKGIDREIKGNVIDKMAVIEKNLGLDAEEKKGVLENLLKDSLGQTQWCLANAITRHAEDASSYDRATELESLGYTVATQSESAFNRTVGQTA